MAAAASGRAAISVEHEGDSATEKAAPLDVNFAGKSRS